MIVGLAMKASKGWNWCYFSFLDLFSVITATEAEKKGYCKNCDWAWYCHPILADGTKLCTKIFKKYYMPKLKMKHLI